MIGHLQNLKKLQNIFYDGRGPRDHKDLEAWGQISSRGLQSFPAFFYFLLDFEPSKGILIDDIKL